MDGWVRPIESQVVAKTAFQCSTFGSTWTVEEHTVSTSVCSARLKKSWSDGGDRVA
jgi:hypothetical protein